MAKFFRDRNYTTTQNILCMPGYNGHTETFISALNIFLSIAAFLENVLIIVALRKVTSKLLLGCLASTDLCVGLITQPIYAYGLLSPEHSKHCYYSAILSNTIGAIFCGVSLLTLTAVSVDRLLALLLRLRYRQVVTLRRMWTLVVTFWLSCTAFAILSLYNYRTAMGIMCITMASCMVTSTCCYATIYIKLRHHQAAVQHCVHQGQSNGGGIPLNIARYRKTVSSAGCIRGLLSSI